MTVLTRTRTALAVALAAFVGLSACGSETGQTSVLQTSVNALRGIIAQRGQAPLTTAVLKTRLTPQVRAQIGLPVLIAELPTLKVAAVIILAARNGAVTTWQSPDGITVSTQGGLLKATRGVGFDLMAADVAEPLAIITGSGTGQARRMQRYLDGENGDVVVRLLCGYTREGRKVTELCVTDRTALGEPADLSIQNHYWLDGQGQIRQSSQWLGARNGYMLLQDPDFVAR